MYCTQINSHEPPIIKKTSVLARCFWHLMASEVDITISARLAECWIVVRRVGIAKVTARISSTGGSLRWSPALKNTLVATFRVPLALRHTFVATLSDCLELKHTLAATLWDGLLHWNIHFWLACKMVSCTKEHTCCYVPRVPLALRHTFVATLSDGLALKHTLVATLWDGLLHWNIHFWLGCKMVSCTNDTLVATFQECRLH